MADYDISDISEASSWADARADTPTLGEHRSDSEDTLSNLSLEDILDNPGPEEELAEVAPPIPAPRRVYNPEALEEEALVESIEGVLSASSSVSFASALNGSVRVCITDADLEMADSATLDLPLGAHYVPTSVDFPRSPSQLKTLKGPSFMPKEDPGVISEDESSISSYRAHLDLNFQNGDVRLTKKGSQNPQKSKSSPNSTTQLKANFHIPQISLEDTSPSNYPQNYPHFNNNLHSIPDDSYLSILSHSNSDDALDDYIEDFILPLSHESVMSRQLSFRRKVQKTYEEVAAEKATQELDKFEAMLSTYDEADEFNRSLTPDPKTNPNYYQAPPIPKTRKSVQNVTFKEFKPQSKQEEPQLKPQFEIEPQSLLDIDAIVKENAPNLMGSHRKGSDHSLSSSGTISNGLSPPSVGMYGSDLESLSNYFLPQQTIDKLYAVYESSNFNNIYCLSGEIKNILSPLEIEEIIANKDHLERFIDPNVMAALSWSLNPASLPPHSLNSILPLPKKENDLDLPLDKLTLDPEDGLKSKSSSMSNGFHSDASSEDDNHSTASSSASVNNSSSNKGDLRVESESGIESPSPTGQQFERDQLTNSMRRRIALKKRRTEGCHDQDQDQRNEDDMDDIDLGVGDEDWEDDQNFQNNSERSNSPSSNGVCLIRRDSKRFSFKGKDGTVIDRVIEGVFVESMNSNPNGTLRRIKAPLNLMGGEGHEIEVEMDSPSPEPPEPSSLVRVGGDETDSAKGQKTHRKKISVDEHILSAISTDMDDADESQATDVTQSDVFHSIRNPTLMDEDPTIRTEDGEDDDEITLDIDTPDDMEDSIMGQLESIGTSPMDRIPPLPLDPEELDDSMRWKSFRVGPTDVQIDLQAIHPYRKCLSHGGYFDAEKNVAIILFSGCSLPDRTSKDYTYLMDHLFLYVLSTLEELIVEDYILVYLHGATPKSCVPTYGWLKKCYHLINHRLRKNLKGLYLVHPTFWLRTVVALTRPFVSTKFSRKVRFMNTLSDLCLEIPTEHLVIPDTVLQYDFDLKVDDLKRRKLMS